MKGYKITDAGWLCRVVTPEEAQAENGRLHPIAPLKAGFLMEYMSIIEGLEKQVDKGLIGSFEIICVNDISGALAVSITPWKPRGLV